MILVKGFVSIGFHGAEHEHYFEFENDVSDKEIDEFVTMWGNEKVEIGWERIEDGE